MSKKDRRITALVASLPPSLWNPYYAAYFACFNRQLYFEAHEALEQLWLTQRSQTNSAFYKGLIQAAGAFLHLKNRRLDPAARLLRLAAINLRPFAPRHDGLDVHGFLELIESYLRQLESTACQTNPYNPASPPVLRLGSE